MIFNALFIGALAAFAAIAIFRTLPNRVKNFLTSHFFICEVVGLIFFYMLITSVTESLTGIAATVVAGALWTLYYHLEKQNGQQKPRPGS